MSSPPFEYRHRYLLHTILYILGFVAPWNFIVRVDPAGTSAHTWGWVAAALAQSGAMNIAFAFKLLLIVAIMAAISGAFLRTWGSSYLGAKIVESSTMHTTTGTMPGIFRAGPYGYLRNPLYLGTILHTLALALIMPGSGAIFVLIAIPLLQVRLIMIEESFLRGQLGATYEEYRGLVPRLLPALRVRVAAQSLTPRWGQAIVSESYMWGVGASFVVAGWWYNSFLLIQCVVVSFGASLVIRAFGPGSRRV